MTDEALPKYCDTTSMPSIGELEIWARTKKLAAASKGAFDYWSGFHHAILVIAQQKRLESCDAT